MSTSPSLVVADRYRLVAPLGQGGMGRVWRATDVVLHRDVAIKELVPPPGLTPDERQEMRERSLREARAIARLNNINVVRVFDVLRTDADPWIVMEYVPSRSLQDTLAADGPFPPVRAAEIGLGVLNALRAAHRAGVVHRDVKPGNVLIGADGRVVLTDFGLATVPGDPNVTRTGLVLGSPAYIAPERARDGTAGPGADLWSLGATLYAAVEGASPFARPSAIATLAALATENPPPARNAGPLKPVLNGLLRKDPAHRINAEEAERLLLRATGRRSKLTFPMSSTMRRPGVGRERPALPGPPPVVPGASTASGSAPVVPGPRPPVTPGRRTPVTPPPTARPPVIPPAGRPAAAAGGEPRPVFAPGKASVGRPVPSADTPTRVDGPKIETPDLDATRADTPPVRDRGRAGGDKSVSGTGAASPQTPGRTTPEAAAESPSASANSALARGTRGAYGTISAAEIAAHRNRTTGYAPPATSPPPAPPTASAAPAVEDRAPGSVSWPTDKPDTADKAATGHDTRSAGPEASPAEEAVQGGSADAESSASAVESKPSRSATRSMQTAVPASRPAAPESETAVPENEAAVPESETAAPAAAEAGTAPAGDAAATSETGTAPPGNGTPTNDASSPTTESTDAEAAAEQAAAEQPAVEQPAAERPAADQAASFTPDQGADLTRPDTDTPAAGGPIAHDDSATADADAPRTESDSEAASRSEQRAASKPAVGARAGTARSKSRRKGRGRAAAAGTAAGAVSAAAAELPASQQAEAAELDDKTQTDPDQNDSATEAASERAPTSDDTKAADATARRRRPTPTAAESADVVELPRQGSGPEKAGSGTETSGITKATAPKAPKVAAARSGDRKVTTASVTAVAAAGAKAATTSTNEATKPGPGETSVIPTARSGKTGAKNAGARTGAAGFNGSNRPAWQPMSIPARPPKTGGITVLGTTLTQRQTIIAGAALLAVILLLVFLLPKAFGSGDSGQNGDGQKAAAPPASAAATQQGTSAPAAPVASATQAPTSAPPTSAPATTQPAGGSVVLPAGWYLYKDGTGFSVPVPKGWRISHRGSEVYFEDNTGGGRLLIVDQTRQPKADPVKDWQTQEAARKGSYRNYRKIGIRPVSYWDKAADWEFTRTSDNGNPLRVVKRGFITAKDQAYGISWSTSTSAWNANKDALALIYKGFKPARS